MHPTLFTWTGIGFHTWGLMITIAFAAACLVTSARVPRVGIDADRLVPLYLLAPIFGLAGARLLHFMMAEPKLFFAHPGAFFDMDQGGFAFYGGAILGSVGGLLWAYSAHIPLLKLSDAIGPSVLLGDMFGRVGCFFAGCCHGRDSGATVVSTIFKLQGGEVVQVAGFPWVALIYRRGVGVGDTFDVPLYPTQPWEGVGTLAIFLFLSWMWFRHRRFDGQIAAMTLLLYAPLRFFVERFRGDEVRGTGYLGLYSTSQMVSFGMFALGLVLLAVQARRGIAPETPYRGDDLADDEL